MKTQRGFTVVELAVFLVVVPLVIGGLWGWVWNIVKLASADFAVISGMLVLRVVGIFLAPLGAVLGFC